MLRHLPSGSNPGARPPWARTVPGSARCRAGSSRSCTGHSAGTAPRCPAVARGGVSPTFGSNPPPPEPQWWNQGVGAGVGIASLPLCSRNDPSQPCETQHTVLSASVSPAASEICSQGCSHHLGAPPRPPPEMQHRGHLRAPSATLPGCSEDRLFSSYQIKDEPSLKRRGQGRGQERQGEEEADLQRARHGGLARGSAAGGRALYSRHLRQLTQPLLSQPTFPGLPWRNGDALAARGAVPARVAAWHRPGDDVSRPQVPFLQG